MNKKVMKIILVSFLVIFLGSSVSAKGDSFNESDHFQWDRAFMDVPDFQVNQENYSSTFDQTSPSVSIFKDGSFVVVWQDERNGDWDVFAQKLDSSGAVIGTNFQIPEESEFSDQLYPDVSRFGDSSFIVVWVEDEEQNIYAQRFNPNLYPQGSRITVNENPIPTPDLKPALATFPDGGFVVVWQDTRVGVNIYARLFDSAGDPRGASFKVNDGTSILPESPSVAVDTSSAFIVVWNDSRDGDKDIYFKRYDTSGNPIGTDIIANTDLGTEVQYQPQVALGKDKEFMITWIDLRNGDEDIYARLFFWDGTAKTGDKKVNSGADLQIDPDIVADSSGKFIITWVDYRKDLPSIYVQRYDTDGNDLGPNIAIYDSIPEVEKTSISINESGNYVICWRHAQDYDFDVYAQMVGVGDIAKGFLIKVNDDQTGAMQRLPRVAADQGGKMLVVWEDQRGGNLKDGSDIYLKKFMQNGDVLFGEFKVNDNTQLLPQKSPDIGVSPSGLSVVVWQDSRDGQNIYGQRIDVEGNHQGGNFKVNRYAGLSVNTHPSCALDWFGNFVVVWNGEESEVKNIYAQQFQSDGGPDDSSFKVNDDGQSVEHLYPKIAMDWWGNFAVAWYDRRDAQERIFLQLYNFAGGKIGDNFALQQDVANSVEPEFDIDMKKDNGFFVTVWIESRSSKAVYAQIYDNAGTPLGSNILVTDDTTSHPQDPGVSVDKDTFFVVTWTDHRDGNPNIYYQKFYLDGTPIDSNMIVHNPESSLQMISDNAVSLTYLYTVWMDNRTPGNGFDIYSSILTYRPEVGVEEELVDQSVLQLRLNQNYPNPFNSTTLIPFTISASPVSSSQSTVHSPIPTTLAIYNVLGQRVKNLVNEDKLPGHYQITWDGKDDSGFEVSSGVYFYRLKTEKQVQTKKLIYLK